MSGPDPSDGAPRPSPNFATTRWSLLLAARDHQAPGAADALASLCQTYWYPVYAYIRRQGNDAQKAQDLTQDFFARILEKDLFGSVERARGKFRAFLLTACKHFLSNERERAAALKRGGGRRL